MTVYKKPERAEMEPVHVIFVISWNDSYKRGLDAGQSGKWDESKFLWLRRHFERGNFSEIFRPIGLRANPDRGE